MEIRSAVAENRRARKWTRREQAGRVLWMLAGLLFRLSPRPFWGWRRWILRLFGAQIGCNVNIHPSVRITIPWNLKIGSDVGIGDDVILYALGSIDIGPRTTISQGAHLCGGTHDWRDPAMPLKKCPITIGHECWICAEAFIGPGVTVGDRVIVAARAVVVKEVSSCAIVGGNPARQIGSRDH